MHIETASFSLQGDRPINQDRCALLVDVASVLLLLSDGMGGHPKGEEAARIMVETGKLAFESVSKPISEPLDFLDYILRTAHKAIVDFGTAQTPPIDPRATGVAALVQNGKAYWSHAGDSRLYLFRDYRDYARTTDHSFVEQLRGRGLRPANSVMYKRYRNLVTQCLGGNGMRFGTSRGNPTELRDRDILLLCTDGLWNQLSEETLGPRMRHHGSLDRMVSSLANAAAQAAAPTSDNVTLVAMRWHDQSPMPQTPKIEAVAEDKDAQPADEVQDAIDHLRSAIENFTQKD